MSTNEFVLIQHKLNYHIKIKQMEILHTIFSTVILHVANMEVSTYSKTLCSNKLLEVEYE